MQTWKSNIKPLKKQTTYRHGICFRVSSVFVLSILFWFPQRMHYFWRVFRFRTKNSEPTYWTILFVMLKNYFIYKVAGKNPEGLYKIELCRLPLRHRLFLSCICHGVTDRTCSKRADWNMPVSYIKYMSLYSALWFKH
jgi:hypothetical protein